MAKERRTNVVINYKVNTAEIEKSNALLLRASKATDDLRKETDKYGKAAKNAGEEGNKTFSNLTKLVSAVAVTAIVQQFISWTKQIIAVRGEFQKLQAILTNTLGSKSQALIALSKINDFAKSTPYSVQELTESFVKLANRGVQPTIVQMRSIGDVAAVLGKQFIQVTEAILDVNNSERWKEIGIQVKTMGDKVALSFKGITQVVDNSVQGVTLAVEAFGKLNGVAGSTEAISKTLTGQVSNLGDAWTQLLNTIGHGNEGILSEAVNLLSRGITAANELVKGNVQKFEELQSKILGEQLDTFKEFAKGYSTLEEALIAYGAELDKNFVRIEDESKAQKELANQQLDYVDRLTGSAEGMKMEKEAAQEKLKWLNNEYLIYSTDVIPAIREYIKAIEDKNKSEKDALGLAMAKKDQARMKALANAAQEYLAYLSDLEMFQLKQTLQDKTEQRKKSADTEREINKTSYEHWKYYDDLKRKKQKEAADEEIRITEETAARKKDIEQQAHDAAFIFARALTDFVFTSKSNETQAIEDHYSRQKELAGDNDRFQKELAIKRDQALEAARQREKEAYKSQSIKKILAETAINIVEAYPDPIRMGLAVALGALQIGTVKKLAKGEIDIKGPGTRTSDSIPAMLSKGESVMTAEETDSSRGIFKLIRAKKLNDKLIQGIVSGRNGGSVFNDAKIVAELSDIKKELAENRPQDPVERHGVLMKATKKSRDYTRYVRLKTMGDF